ncbi:MAG: class I SAM-dependent methyltransferase [Burkholderiaceae bacterium]|nr:class I SAM-dependent methyltransferase [Burkholderiaceae bacterium]
MAQQERERALIRLIRTVGLAPVAEKRVLEIGCGSGSNLLELLGLGFVPENLVANELLEERAALARRRLPQGVRILPGDATGLDLGNDAFDVVYQSTVFTSLLDNAFQQELARRMWQWVKPGGGILWYDFVFDNPRNPDVRGVPVRRIRELFPQADIRRWRVTLAPPISRRVTRLHPELYRVFNAFPFLRTHVLCWIGKNRPGNHV